MELYEEFSQLKIDENLFKDVKFYISGSIPDWIIQLLINGGAKQESHINDFLTHLITGVNPDENEIDEVKDIYEKPVVTHHWVTFSAKCGKILPIEGFSKDPNQIFLGVKAAVSKLGVTDSRAVWGLVQFYGGRCNLDLDHTCTHLIIGKPEGIKYNRALEKTIHIVTPDWVIDSIQSKERQDEYYYHPRLLKLSHSPSPHVPKKRTPKLKKREPDVLLPLPTPVDFESTVAPTLQGTVDDKLAIDAAKPALEKESLFDGLTFSDDDEDDDAERMNLLDQLKNSQPWKKSPTPPSSILPSITSTSDENVSSDGKLESTVQTPVSEEKSVAAIIPANVVSKSSVQISVTNSGGTTLPSCLLKSGVSIVPKQDILLPLTTISIPTAINPSNTKPLPITTSLRSTSEVDISYISKQSCSVSTSSLPPSQSICSPIPAAGNQQPVSSSGLASNINITKSDSFGRTLSKGGPAAFRQLDKSITLESKVTISSVPRSVAIVSSSNSNSPPISMSSISNMKNQVESPLMNTALQTQPNSSQLASSNPISTQIDGNSGSIVRTINQETPGDLKNTIQLQTNKSSIPPSVEQYSTMQEKFGQNTGPKPGLQMQQSVRQVTPTLPGVQGGPPNITIRNNFPANLLPPNARMKQDVGQTQQNTQGQGSVPPNLPQQQVHSVAIPGAVVRLPPGVTQQQLQMMSNEERHKFLDQLHKKQVQEQLDRGKPRGGKPLTSNQQFRAMPSGATIHYSNNGKSAQLSQPNQLPNTWQSQVQPRQMTPASGSASPHFTQDPNNQNQGSNNSNWQQQQQQQQGQQPQLHQRLQQQQLTHQQMQQPQSTDVHPQSQQQMLQSQSVQPGHQGQTHISQQQGQIIQQGQQPIVQSTQPHVMPNNQQQFIIAQGSTTRVMVGQSNWSQLSGGNTQTQTNVQPNQPTQFTQSVQQVQVHAQQLRQHFSHLTQQEAEKLIQVIPTHLREMQARDSAGRFEYLSSLDYRERPIVNHFYLRRHQQQMLQRQLQAQQNQLKLSTSQSSPGNWQQQQPGTIQHQTSRVITARDSPQAFSGGQTNSSQGQRSPHVQTTPMASPHPQSPIQRPDGTTVVPHPLHNVAVPQNVLAQQNNLNPKTKTALANLLTNRLTTTGLPQDTAVATHIVQKSGEIISGQGNEHVTVLQRRTISNAPGTNIVRVQGNPPGSGNSQGGVVSVPYGNRTATGLQAPSGTVYQRPHLFGHDINTMLPRELCMVGCVFYIADYYADLTPYVINSWKRVIQQHGGEIVNLYDTMRVTHVLCKHQRSPVFQQAVRENKRCITIYWLNDILIRGKMAPPWQAIHLPTPFDYKDKPLKDLLVSITGFENEERITIKLMLLLAGAKYTGNFSRFNDLLVCKKFEGIKVTKAREWKKAVVNGMWLSEVLLGQNTPPLVYQSTRYQLYLDDPLRIDPSLASHLFGAWKLPITVSKESVEKAKAVREMALRKRKSDKLGENENSKRARLDNSISTPNLNNAAIGAPTPQLDSEGFPLKPVRKLCDPKTMRILFSGIKSKEELERIVLDFGAVLARTTTEATHLVMGSGHTALRTVKLMCAISCCRYIVSLQWLKDSKEQEGFVEEENYILRMPEFEWLFDFRLSETLMKPNRNELLKGIHFYLTPSVVPGRSYLKEIIFSAGGSVEAKRRSLNEIRIRNGNGNKFSYICIASDPDAHLVRDLVKENMPVYNPEFVLIGILRQNLDFEFAKFQEVKVEE